MGIRESRMNGIIKAFRHLGVKKVGPSHCTGEVPIQRFRKEWSQDFLEFGCGAIVTIRN